MRFTLLYIILLVSVHVAAQNYSQYSMNMLNPYLHNPASAGMNYSLEAQVGHRSQWVQNPYAPKNYFVSATAPIIKYNSSIGLMYESQSIGLEQYSRIALSYGYVYPVGNGISAIAIRFKGSNLKFNGEELISSTGNYEGIIDHNDPLLPTSKVNDWSASGDIGIWYQNRKLRIGISADNILHSGFLINNSYGEIKPNTIYNIYSAYQFRINNSLLLRSAILLKSDFVIVQSHINSYLRVNNFFTAGLSWIGYSTKSFEEIGVTAGVKVNEFLNLYYTYGIGLNKINNNRGGSHEVFLQFDLGKPIGTLEIPKIKYNTRFLE